MSAVARFFNLRPGDLSRGLPLFGYLLLVISGYTIGRSCRDPIFLEHFTTARLPIADGIVAAVSTVVVALYLRAGRRANLRTLQAGSLGFFAATLVALWWGVHVQKSIWAAGLFYIWFGVAGLLTVSQVWTMANLLWTTREAKRLFGVLGTGGIIGGSAGGFLGTAVVHAFGTDALLLVMAGLALAAAVVVSLIWRTRAPDAAAAEALPVRPKHSLRESFDLVRESRHLQVIAALILLSAMATAVAGWQFKDIAKHALQDKDAFASFQAELFGYVGLAAILIQLLLTTRLLRQFGVGLALLILPLSLVIGASTVLIWGALWAATVLKASDGVVRYSIDTSALQLLYLPVPAAIKLQVKSFIDVVVWKAGDCAASLILLLFATTLHFNGRQVSSVTLALLGVWIVVAALARRQYVAALRENIQQVGVDADPNSVATLDRNAAAVVAEKLKSPDTAEVLSALTLLEMGQPRESHAAVRHLLTHPSAEVRQRAVAFLNECADLSVRSGVLALLRDEDIHVRTEALRFLACHDHFDPLAEIEQLGAYDGAAIRSATAAYLARPGDAQNVDVARLILEGMVHEAGDDGRAARREAARVIAWQPGMFDDALEPLLADADPDVLKEALRAAGRLRNRRLAPAIIAHLGAPDRCSDAIDALVQFEDSIVGTLRDLLDDPREPMAIRERIPEVLLRIGSAAAAGALADSLLQSDLPVRARTIAALNQLQEATRHVALDMKNVDTLMIAELIGHYRSYQILGSQGGVIDAALKHTMDSELERIFRLIKLLFPSIDMLNAYAGIQSSDSVRRANALEFLDNTLNSQLRSLLLPLIDSDVGIAERVRLADRYLGFSVPGSARPSRLADQ